MSGNTVKYDLARTCICNGDLLGCGCETLQSRIIQKVAGLDIAHPEILLWQKFDAEVEPRLCTLGSMGWDSGVRLIPLSHLVTRYRAVGGRLYVYPLRESEKLGNRIVAEGLKCWGQPYPGLTQHLLTAAFWLRWLRKRLLRLGPDIDPRAYHCWEFVATALKGSGMGWKGEACEITLAEIVQCGWYEPRYEITMEE